MPALRRVRGLLALSNPDRRLFLRAFIWLAVVDAGLRLRRFQHEFERAQHVDDVKSDVTPAELMRATQLAYWLERASRHHMVRAHCLHRSLALYEWLLQEGVRGEMRIGVRKDGQELKAHAWVELGGYVVNDQAEAIAQFTPLETSTGGVPRLTDWLGRRFAVAPTGRRMGIEWL